jgi:hypothetical protein
MLLLSPRLHCVTAGQALPSLRIGRELVLLKMSILKILTPKEKKFPLLVGGLEGVKGPEIASLKYKV